jgi:7-carboxy-7-deazaguanine synthase
MAGLRLTELYTSVQGEGPKTGVKTVFVRFGGCNMRCPGWPCDTPQAILPEQWKNDPLVDPDKLVEMVLQQPGAMNVCITGGEPTMQPPQKLKAFVEGLLELAYTIDVFTNGSLVDFPTWMYEPEVTVILDWKLQGSGEAQRGTDTRLANLKRLKANDVVKFVIASDADYLEAVSLWKLFKDMTRATFWAGVAWGKFNEDELVEEIIANRIDWHLNVQVHKYIWEPEARRV